MPIIECKLGCCWHLTGVILPLMGKTDKQLKLVSARIRNLRELRGYSQDYMAHKLNISVSAYSRIERCEVQLTVDKLIQIKEILSTDYLTILEGETSKSPIVTDSLMRETELNDALRQQITLLREHVEFLKNEISKKNKN